MISVEKQVAIVPVSFSEILDAPNSPSLLQAYAEECLIPDATPQRLTYEALEGAGALRCFAAFVYPEDSPLLVGFVSVLVAVMPHHGNRLATVESLFVDSDHRDTGAGNLLLEVAEKHARESGCLNLVCTARVGSAFDKVLSRRAGYQLTHVQHTRRLV